MLLELITTIATIASCIVSLSALFGIFSKTGRKIIGNFINKYTDPLQKEVTGHEESIEKIQQTLCLISEQLKPLNEFSKQQCRDVIKNTYYKYVNEKKMPLYERKTLDQTYILYTGLFKSNSYATLLYEAMKDWEVVGEPLD